VGRGSDPSGTCPIRKGSVSTGREKRENLRRAPVVGGAGRDGPRRWAMERLVLSGYPPPRGPVG